MPESEEEDNTNEDQKAESEEATDRESRRGTKVLVFPYMLSKSRDTVCQQGSPSDQ